MTINLILQILRQLRISANSILPVIFLLSAFQLNAFSQEIFVPPSGIVSQNVPNIPKSLETELRGVSKRTASNLLGWTKDSSLIGYSQYYEPFFKKSPSDNPATIEIDIDEPEAITLQPGAEKYLLFTKDNAGDENTQLLRYDLQTKSTESLTNSPEIEFVNSYAWSDDGATVYFINQKKKINTAEICALNISDKTIRHLTKLDGDTQFIAGVRGDNLLFSRYFDNNHTAYYLFNLKTSKIIPLTKAQAFYRVAKFNRTGDKIYWLSNETGNYSNLYSYDLRSKKIVKINDQELNVTNFEVSPDEKSVALKINADGAETLKIFTFNAGGTIGREISSPQIQFGVISNIKWRNADEVGFGFESLKHPPEIKTLNIRTNALVDWTKGEFNKSVSDLVQEPQLIKWQSFDRREISGFILKPLPLPQTAGRKLPVLIDIHGGPNDQYQPYFGAYRCYDVVKLQMAIVFPNIRGSSGFGREFENLDNQEKRVDAVRDLEFLLNWIAAQPDLDSSKIIVRGSSYGGFMAMALGLRNKNRIKGVIAEVPPVSIKNYINNSAKSLQEIYGFEYGKTSDEKLMTETENLSLLGADNLSKWGLPLLLTAGQNDVRVPIADIEKANEELTKKGQTIWYLKANNEGHFWGKKDNIIYLELAKIAFFSKYGIQ